MLRKPAAAARLHPAASRQKGARYRYFLESIRVGRGRQLVQVAAKVAAVVLEARRGSGSVAPVRGGSQQCQASSAAPAEPAGVPFYRKASTKAVSTSAASHKLTI